MVSHLETGSDPSIRSDRESGCDRLSMSAHSPGLQFVTGLPDSPKIEAKGVILVRGPWYETPDSLGLSFDVNQSLMFPGWS